MTTNFHAFVDFLKSQAGTSAREAIEATRSREELYTTMTRIAIEQGFVVSSADIDTIVADKLPAARDVLSETELLAVAGGNLSADTRDSSQPPWTGGTEIPSHCPSPCFPANTTNIYCKVGSTVTGNCSIVGSCGGNDSDPSGTLSG